MTDQSSSAPFSCPLSLVHPARRPPRQEPWIGLRVLFEQLGELFGHGTAELLGVDDGHGATIVARDIVADADGDQLDRRAGLDFLDDPAQMALEIIAGV